MCVKPITLHPRLQDDNKFLKYQADARYIPADIRRMCVPSQHPQIYTVPCGKCIECLRAKQSDLAARCVREADRAGSMAFLTLTYDEQSLPLSAYPILVNEDTGEVFELGMHPFPLQRLSKYDLRLFGDVYINDFRTQIFYQRKSPKSRLLTVKASDYNGYQFDLSSYQNWSTYYHIVPSLYRRDVRLWLKKARVDFERSRGEKLPSFKYLLAGEMGPNTCRPHYHILFFGLPKHVVHWLAARWTYGFTYTEFVNCVNKDGSSGYSIAARYVSKYMIKGKFEADSVLHGYAERPRICLSHYLGTYVDDRLSSYLLGFDLFGVYDLRTLQLKSGEKLTSSQLRSIFNNWLERRYFTVQGRFKFLFPKLLIDNVLNLKYTYYDFDVKKNVSASRASTLRRVFNYFVETDFLEDDQRAIDSYTADLQERSFTDFLRDESNSRDCNKQTSAVDSERNLLSFYKKSKF